MRLMASRGGRPGFLIPHLKYPEILSPDLVVLRKEYAWHIGGTLPQQEVEEWKLLYHSAIDGLSFATFMADICSGDGPTVLVIKDTEVTYMEDMPLKLGRDIVIFMVT